MNIQERVLLVDKFLQDLNNIPTERKASHLVVNVMVRPEENGLFKKHMAKMVIDPQTFMDTFTPDNGHVTVTDASFFGYEVRYAHNDVIVDCVMSKEQLAHYYGDFKLVEVQERSL